jgi:hypothetical protein
MQSEEIYHELSQHNLTGPDIAIAVGCDESIPNRVIRTRRTGRPGTLRYRCAEEIARSLNRSFAEVWGPASSTPEKKSAKALSEAEHGMPV